MMPASNYSNAVFPWYDSPWLNAYTQAKEIILRECPHKLNDFERSMERLQAPAGVEVQHLSQVLDAAVLERIKRLINRLEQEQLERHEFFRFGRNVLHDHVEFTNIQLSLADTVSSLVGEAVQPSYNFLALYNNLGVCEVHMDSPFAKWTLDICIAQSDPWPIKFSQCVPWPEGFKQTEQDWHSQIVSDPNLRFRSYALEENEAVVFCGSNQWHYRDRISRARERNFCHLLFLHYVPVGCDDLLYPSRWYQLFDIPELACLSDAPVGFDE